MWRIAGASVRGTSHVKLGIPCQDYCGYRRALLGSSPALVIAIADGAGSASLSHIGSRATAEHLLHEIPLSFASIADASDTLAHTWFQSARDHLHVIATEQSCDMRDLACTVLVAILADFGCFFAQIGDGAWIAQKDKEYLAATWPSGGEYANETTFITSPNWSSSITSRLVFGGISAAAGFTDGIQRLALQIGARSVHAPFFDPLFSAVRATDDETSLVPALIEFLSSTRVSERTDDDKTLVLAANIEPLLLTEC